MTESINNRSFVPLLANRVYIGSYDTVSAYCSATISCLADVNTEIVCYQSQNKIQQSTTTYASHAGVQFKQELQLTNPFVEFTVRNTSGTDGTLLAFTVIYRVNQTCTINSDDAILVADTISEGYLQTIAGALPITSGKVKITDTNGSNIYSTESGQLETALYNQNGVPVLTNEGGNLLVVDSVAEGYLSNIVTGLSNPLSVNIVGTVISNNGLNVALFDSTGVPFTSTSGWLDVNIKNNGLPILDSSSNQILAVNTCLQTALFDGTGTNAISSTANALNVQTQAGLALDASLQTIITNTQTLIDQVSNNGGVLWNAATLIPNNDVSASVNLSTKSGVTYSYFGSCIPDTPGDSPILTIQYSGDGITFFPSPNIINIAGGGNFAIDTISGAGFINCVVSGLTTTCSITMILNHL